MSETYVPAELWRLVVVRAQGRCEYCHIEEADTWFGCEVDHVISEKHGGLTEEANLALACVTCNRAKGSDVATRDDDGGVVEIFHPRRHQWTEHFGVDGLLIAGRAAIGRGHRTLALESNGTKVALHAN